MAELIFRFPSKVPYGYVELRTQLDQDPTPEELAEQYVSSFLRYKKAEEAALQAPVTLKSPPASVATVDEVLSEDEAVATVVATLGATEVSDAPWDNKPDEKAKEWSAPADSAWDFD